MCAELSSWTCNQNTSTYHSQLTWPSQGVLFVLDSLMESAFLDYWPLSVSCSNSVAVSSLSDSLSLSLLSSINLSLFLRVACCVEPSLSDKTCVANHGRPGWSCTIIQTTMWLYTPPGTQIPLPHTWLLLRHLCVYKSLCQLNQVNVRMLVRTSWGV